MKQKIFNITISRDIHQRSNHEIGVLTCIRAERCLPNGRKIPHSNSCTYEIKKGSALPELRHFKEQFSTVQSGRRAA